MKYMKFSQDEFIKVNSAVELLLFVFFNNGMNLDLDISVQGYCLLFNQDYP